MRKYETLKAWEAIKALEEGKQLEFRYSSHWVLCNSDSVAVLEGMEQGFEYRIKQEEGKTVEMFGHYNGDRIDSEQWAFCELFTPSYDTHKITFKEDEEGNPICESIKMMKL